jgi:hypothetical protein
VVGSATMDGEPGRSNTGGVARARAEVDETATGAADIAGGVAAEAVVGAAMPRLSIKALSSSISAFMAANSLATAGGMAGSCKFTESTRLAAVVAPLEALAESSKAEEELLPCFADVWFAATSFEAVVDGGACATDFVPANRQKMVAVKSKTGTVDNGILMIALFMLVMEQSFPQWNNAWRDLRLLRILRLHPWTGVNQFHQLGRKDRVMNS